MNNSIFRKKNLDRISSPEDLNSYMRVTNPPVWFVVGVVLLVLVGAIVWGIFGKIETKITAVTVSSENGTVCYVSQKDIQSVKSGLTVRIDGNEYTVVSADASPVEAQTVLNEYAMHLSGYSNGEYVYAVNINAELTYGNYETFIVTESISAISFIIN